MCTYTLTSSIFRSRFYDHALITYDGDNGLRFPRIERAADSKPAATMVIVTKRYYQRAR